MDWTNVLNSPVVSAMAGGILVILSVLVTSWFQSRERDKERKLQWGARLYEKRLTAYGTTVRPILTMRALAGAVVGGGGNPENRLKYQNSLINLDWARHAQRPYLPKQFSKHLEDFADAAATIWVSTADTMRLQGAAKEYSETLEQIRQHAKVLLDEIGQAVGPWVNWFESQMVRTLKHPQKK
ncbi:MAG: hypothetical protein ACE5JC_00290 [Candidatus Zixiibacteriota bacterium]